MENEITTKKTFVMGDIHGGHKAMIQCFERSGFNKETDRLISLGDVVDGWPDIVECIEELRSIKDLIFILGNHDEWARRFMSINENRPPGFSNSESHMWVVQGGQSTIDAYTRKPEFLKSHLEFLNNAYPYYLDIHNNLFVHGGFNPEEPIDQQDYMDLCWNRHLTTGMYNGRNYCKDYNQVFVGHCPTLNYDSTKVPINRRNFWLLDTGATYTGALTIMDLETKEYWQSDKVMTLYPDDNGRNHRSYNSTIK